MKTIRELNIKDWSGSFFEEMVSILDIYPEYFMVSNAKECIMLYNLCYSDKIGVPHIVFNNIYRLFFQKSNNYSFLIFFADGKNKNMMCNYGKIVKQLEDEIFSFADEFEDEKFIFDGNLI